MFQGDGAPVGSPALALLLPQTSDPEPANQLPGPYTYASHSPMQGSGGTSGLPGANPGRFAAWLLGLEANEDPGGLIGLGQAIVRVFLYVACVLDGECLASLTELQALGEELGSSAQVTMRWTGKLLSRAATMWPLLPQVPTPLATLFSLGLGFTPVLGDLYDLYSGVTGYDPITGEYLSGGERALAIGAAFLPLMSASNLRVSAKVLQWSDDVRLLFRTGIWGGTIRKIARALPDSVVIGVRGRPVMAALWEGIYLVTGKFEPKPGIFDATEVAWEVLGRNFSSVAEFFGLRRMKDLKTGREFFAHSDIDLQLIVKNGAPVVDIDRVKQI